MPKTVVIGGGAIGLATAYELGSRGESVHLLDRGNVGQATSWAAAGIIPPGNAARAHDSWGQLCGESYRLHQIWSKRLLRETGIDVEYRVCGGLHIARTRGELAALAAAAQQWTLDGIDVEPVSPHHIVDLEPSLAIAVEQGLIRKAFYLPREAQIRSPRFVKALRSGCLKQGVQISENVRITDVRREATQVNSIETTDGSVTADTFCVAAGAWTGKFLTQFGMNLEMPPWRGQIVLIGAKPGLLKHVINEGPNYLVPRTDGLILIGSTVEEVGFNTQTTPAAVTELRQYAESLVPALELAPTMSSWAGLRPGSIDGRPYLGRVPHLENVFVAAGHYRSGVHLAPVTARVMSHMMLGLPPAIDLTEFGLQRG